MKELVNIGVRLVAASTEGKSNTLKIFIAEFLYSMDKYFSKVNYALYSWLENPLPVPDVSVSENLRKIREKLERKVNRMCSKHYKKRFEYTWYKEWDDERKMPLKGFNSKLHWEKLEEVYDAISAAKCDEEAAQDKYVVEKIEEELSSLLNEIFTPFEAMREIKEELKEDVANLKIVSYVIQTTAIEHILSFIKRACSVLGVDIKKRGAWRERSIVLARFLLSFKERIKGFSECMDIKILTTLQDVALGTELFLVETNNLIIAQERQAQTQRELQETLGRGFHQIISHLSVIEEGVLITNKRLAGIDGRLIDLLRVNERMMCGITENGRLIGDLSLQLDGISSQLSSIGDAVSYIAFGGDETNENI